MTVTMKLKVFSLLCAAVSIGGGGGGNLNKKCIRKARIII